MPRDSAPGTPWGALRPDLLPDPSLVRVRPLDGRSKSHRKGAQPVSGARAHPRSERKSRRHSTAAAYAAIGVTLLFLVVVSMFDPEWFEGLTRDAEWNLLSVAVLLLASVAGVALVYIATHSISLRRAMNLAHLERDAEMGQMAAGLAHEIRNPLHAVRLNLYTFDRLQQGGAQLSPAEVTRMLQQSRQEIERIDRLMQELVGFASPQEARNEPLDVQHEIEGIVDLLGQEMQWRDVQLGLDLPPEPVTVLMDRGRFRQVLLNLLNNALDALTDTPKKEIGIAVARVGRRIEISVSDNGPGIPEDLCNRIFQPFFTTKTHGSGLGLALVKRFIDEAHGSIRCESHDASGTTFTFAVNR